MSGTHSEFEYMKCRVLRGEIFDSLLDDVETGESPSYGALSLSLEVSLEPVEEYVRSTLDVDISSLRQDHPV